MKVTLFMAVSANGIIATKTGSEDFLSHTNWIQFVKLARRVGCFVWGRKTYEAVNKWDGNFLEDLGEVKKIIISKSNIDLKDGFDLAHSPEEALMLLKNEGFNEIIIAGGSTINSEFARVGLVDEVIFNVNPLILGEGIPVFQPAGFELLLDLIDSKQVDGGIVELHYKVKR